MPAEAGRSQPGRDLDAGRAPGADGQPRLGGVLQGLELGRRGRVHRCRLEGPATVPLRHAVCIQLAEEDASSAGLSRLLQDLTEERPAVRCLKNDEVTGRQRRRPGVSDGEGSPVSGRCARRT